MSLLGNRNIIFPALVLIALTISGTTEGRRFHIRLINNCGYPVWPAWIESGSQRQICPGGTFLKEAQEYHFFPSTLWSGYIWARTNCAFNASTGHGTCETGGCNGSFGCKTLGAGPITLAEFSPNRSNQTLRYHISFLHGFNVPLAIFDFDDKTSHNCSRVSCPCDTTTDCPAALVATVGDKIVGCRSPCEHFKTDEYCCRGNFTGEACKNDLSNYFKNSCRDAVAYPTERDSFLSCGLAVTYDVTFCPEDTMPSLRRAAI